MSDLEAKFAFQVKAAKLPEPVTQYQFAKPRRWKFDFAWLAYMVAVEVEGGLWIRGRHSRAPGMKADMEKYNTATLMGWTVLRVCDDHIDSGEALEWATRAIRLKT